MTSIVSPIPRSFELEAGRGAINGITPIAFAGSNPDVGTSFETLWDVGGIFVYPIAGETWEIVSNNVNDTLLGTGARQLVISGLDDNYLAAQEVVNLNGTTPVLTITTTWFRINGIVIISSGSSQFNEGTITLRVSGAGDIRSQILPQLSASFNGFFTVPIGKTLFLSQISSFIPKGEDVTIVSRVLIFGTNTWISGSNTEIYQNPASIEFKTLPAIPERSDIEFRVSSTNQSVRVTVSTEGTLVSTS